MCDQRAAETGEVSLVISRLESVCRWPRWRRHEVVEGPVSVAQPGRRGDGPVHEVDCVLYGALERAAERQTRGDGAESVQPVPWVEVVSSRGRVKRRTVPRVTSTSTTSSPVR